MAGSPRFRPAKSMAFRTRGMCEWFPIVSCEYLLAVFCAAHTKRCLWAFMSTYRCVCCLLLSNADCVSRGLACIVPTYSSQYSDYLCRGARGKQAFDVCPLFVGTDNCSTISITTCTPVSRYHNQFIVRLI